LTLPNIRDWYDARNGSLQGLPVAHFSVNIVANTNYQDACDQFVLDRRMTLVGNDYNTNAAAGPIQTNACHDMFAPALSKPVFIIINCVSNSPSHAMNSLLMTHVGTGFAAAITNWKAIIDSIEAPRPQLTGVQWTDNGVQFTFPGQQGRTNHVLGSANLKDWAVLGTFYGTNGPITFRDTNVVPPSLRFYRLRRL
jgi:hypothetical protein